MGVSYSIVSDTAREGYELGEGPWSDLPYALRFEDPVGAIHELLVEYGWEPVRAAAVAQEIAAFAAARPDWRVIDDHSSDIDAVTDEERAMLVAEGQDPDDPDFPLYRKVGSRYREDVS